MFLRAIAQLKTIMNIPSLLGVLIFIGSIIGFYEVHKLDINDSLVFIFFMSLFLIIIFFSCLLIIYGLKTNQFIQKYYIAEYYVDGLVTEPSSNLFKQTLEMMMCLIVGIVSGLIGAWYVYYTKNIGMWLLLSLCVFYTIYIFRGEKGFILFHIIYLPVVFLLISVKAEKFVGFFALFFIFVLMFGKHMALRRTRNRKTETSSRGVSLKNFIKLIRCLSADVHNKMYGKSSSNFWESTVIVIIFICYIVLPNIIPFIPPDERQEIQQLLIKVNQSKDYIPHVAFFFYCGLSIAPLLSFFSRFLSFRHENKAWKRGINFILLIGVGFLIMPMFVLLSVTLSFLILNVIDSIMGFYFTVILGFFVFPIWVTRLYAFIPALILLIIPDYILKAWVNGKDMWAFLGKEFGSNAYDK